jgi:hypothetical protein
MNSLNLLHITKYPPRVLISQMAIVYVNCVYATNIIFVHLTSFPLHMCLFPGGFLMLLSHIFTQWTIKIIRTHSNAILMIIIYFNVWASTMPDVIRIAESTKITLHTHATSTHMQQHEMRDFNYLYFPLNWH